jgi:hypothetical protein
MSSVIIKSKSLLMILALFFVTFPSLAKSVIYVKSGANGDGSSWSNAFGNVQQAVDLAAKTGADVWVAKGVYKGDSTAVVSLKPNVSLYGGFAGTETSLSVRDTAKNPTVLDGDNAIRVISQVDDFADTSAVVVDGFTIQNGMASNGGGAFLKKNATISNCILKNNGATLKSVGLAIYAKNAKIKNCIICNNSSNEVPWTVYLLQSEMDSCVVKDNAVISGSALYGELSTISNSVIDSNKNIDWYVNPPVFLNNSKLVKCVVKNNYGQNAGVRACNNSEITGCTFSNNISTQNSVIHIETSSKIEDSEIFDNEGLYYEVIYLIGSSSMNRCKVFNNVVDRNHCIVNIRNNSTLSNSLIYGNEGRENAYAPLVLVYSSMVNTTFADNETSAIYAADITGSTVTNSIIVGTKFTGRFLSHLDLKETNNITYSMIEGGADGEGNIDGNRWGAAFVNPSNGDYSLSKTSLCLNAGTDVADTVDLRGNVRKQMSAVDMGAIESSFSGRASTGPVVYVKAGAEGSGSSWEDALGDISQAITLASAMRKKPQIWVAKGSYYGDTTRPYAITLSAGVSLYGGFAGTESSLGERDVVRNVTIIDGDSKRRCVVQNYVFADSLAIVVDGFTIRNGAGKNGAGVAANTKKNTTFRNCIFSDVVEGDQSVYAEKTHFKNCKFVDIANRILEIKGGVVDSCAILNNRNTRYSSSIYLEASVFSNSLVSGCSAILGVFEAMNNSVVSACRFENNETAERNVILLNSSTLENSLVFGNKTRDGQAPIVSVNHASFITNATVAHNITVRGNAVGHGSSAQGVYTMISNSIIYGNKATHAVVPQVDSSDHLKVSYCASDGELTGENNIRLALANSGSDASKKYVCFIDAAGGDYRLHATSACIDMGIDSVMTAKRDINGGARIYGKAIDMGAIEFDGEYVRMLEYSQVVCYDKTTLEATFDSTISKIDWEIVDASDVTGFEHTSGSGSVIPAMRLRTASDNVDTLTLKVTPYNVAGEEGVPFDYKYLVYPDLSELKILFLRPQTPYEVNAKSADMAVEWKKLPLAAEANQYDFYLWKASQEMPSAPKASFTNRYRIDLLELDNHTTYKYMVRAVFACDTVYSEVDSFRIDIPANLEIYDSPICELGTKLNDTTYSRRYIKGFELKDTITYTLSGEEVADFSVQLADAWNALTGGSFDIYYTPTDANKPLSNATLTFQSGSFTAVMDLKGILANYYVFDAVVENDVYKAGDTIMIKSSVVDAMGKPYENKQLKVTLRKDGSPIMIKEVTSDAHGEAIVKYVSSAFECGVYSVGVCLSTENTNVTHDEFNIPGISCVVGADRWLVQKGDTIRGTILVKNHSNVESRNVKVKTISLASGCKVVFDSIDVLRGLEEKSISYYLTGESITEGSSYLPSTFRVLTGEGLSTDFSTYFYCEMPYGQIKVLPANITEYVSKQNPKYVELMLCNTGLGETGGVSVALPSGFEGMTMPGGTEINSIKPGDTVRTVLKLAYYEGAKLNMPIYGTIGVNCENGKSTSITYSVEYTSSVVGSVSVDVVDEYYYNTADKPHLAGATVEIRNAFSNEAIASGVTDSTGKVHFDNIPEGDYLLVVNADKHAGHRETITVQAGQNLNKFVFVSYQAVTYTWNVVPTEIEDKYEYSLEMEYETNVPVPVVTAEFISEIPDKSTFNVGEKYVANLLITNHGLIAAKNVRINAQHVESFRIKPAIDHFDSLPGNFSVLVPVSIERVKLNGDDNNSGDEGCSGLAFLYEYVCDTIKAIHGYVPIWRCPSFDINLSGGDASGHVDGAIAYFGASSSTGDPCPPDTCEGEVNALIDCILDIIGWIPLFGDAAEDSYVGAKRVGDIISAFQASYSAASAVGDAIDGKNSERDKYRNLYNASAIGMGFIPIIGDFIPFGCYDLLCQLFSCLMNGVFAENCGEYLYDLEHKNTLRSADVNDFYKTAPPHLLAYHDLLEFYKFEAYRFRFVAECVGADDEMMKKTGLVDYLDFAIDSFALRRKIDIDRVKELPVTDLSLTEMIAISERWNRSMDAWDDSVFSSNEKYPDIADKNVLIDYLKGMENFYYYVAFRGFLSTQQLKDFIIDQVDKQDKKRKGVCASVKLHISQTMTMTREAFDGTLTVNNGNETRDMDNFKIVLEIRDEKGNLANDLFQINTQSLKGIDAVDGSSTIGAGEEITASFRFIPEKGAAPKTPVRYSFGGKIIYVESGDTFTLKLNPVMLTVNPSPDLQIDYFMQRNILGDDALTKDRVEPSVPAALGVRIDNQGYGAAKNVKLETAQPEIVDNEKGLLIEFDIIGSSLDGKDCNLGSENINFGDINSRTAKTGVWWMTSSLLGHFTKYEASVAHTNSYGNADLSLVKGIAVHELIKTVDAYGLKADHVVDFLVNDQVDGDDIPDAIYYSDGGVDSVSEAHSTRLDKDRVSSSDTVVRLSVIPSQSGWNYAQTYDPGDNCYEIQRVVRLKDGVEIPLDNVWTTFVTLPDAEEPIYENRLHFLDYMTALEETDYDIYFSPRKNLLEVTSITGTPLTVNAVREPIDSVIVHFNRKIQKESFDYKDIELYCQAGDNLSDSTFTVKQLDDYTYVVNISSKTNAFGFYRLEVNVNNVYDEDGYPGEFGRSATWVQYVDGEEPGAGDDPGTGDDPGEEPTPIVDVEDGKVFVYAYQNCIYVKSARAGTLDIYDILSKLVVKNAHYDVGVTPVAVLPKGAYIVNGKKVIVK